MQMTHIGISHSEPTSAGSRAPHPGRSNGGDTYVNQISVPTIGNSASMKIWTGIWPFLSDAYFSQQVELPS